MGIRYVLSELRAHGADSHWLRSRFLTHVVGRYFARNPPPSTKLVDLDWDHAIVLDACRHDLFEEVIAAHDLPGETDVRRAAQSGTPGYLAENFGGRTAHDIVYVTANPYVSTELPPGTFHAVDHVWRDGWDSDRGTVMPDVMADRALAMAERYPDKRLIVHFNQPHAPFVGEVPLGVGRESAIRAEALGETRPDPNARQPSPFEMLDKGLVSRAEVWRAYRSNLTVAVPAVERLLEGLPGKVAITADHGNGLGERAWPFPVRVYGHPVGVLIPALTCVPWHVVTSGERPAIVADPPVETEAAAEGPAADRLRSLGYTE